MRYPPVIGPWLALAAMVLATGCGGSAQPTQPIRLRPMPGNLAVTETPMFQVRLVRLQQRLRPDAPAEDIWRLLGTSTVPYEKHALWEANDLRIGDGAQLAADRLNTLVAETPDRTVHTSMIMIRENMDFAITLGPNRDGLDLLWSDTAARLMGRRFERAQPQLRCVCRSDPDDPEAVRLAMVPEVLYGQEALHWVRTETGLTQQLSRPSFVVSDLAAEVRLKPDRLLVLGGRHSSDVSLGGAIFFEHRDPDLWTETLVLTVERMKPGQVAAGESIPVLTPPGAKPRPPAPAPKAAPPRSTGPVATGPQPMGVSVTATGTAAPAAPPGVRLTPMPPATRN